MKQTSKIFALSGVMALAIFVMVGCGQTTTTTTTNKNVNKKSNVNTVSNTNTAQKTTITTDKTSYTAGETITVTYNVVDTLKTGAWLGIIPSSTAHGTEDAADAVDVAYQYLDGSSIGTKTFTAPLTAGSYDFRVFDTDGTGGVELGTVTFTVTAQ